MISEPFNKLTPAQVERLAILSEELGEVQQVIGKILRHGYESYHPDGPYVTNRQLLEKELGDVHYAMGKLYQDGEVSSSNILCRAIDKMKKVKQYLHENDD